MPDTESTPDALNPLPEPAKCIPDQSQLSDDDKALIWHLHKAGKPQTEIAHVVGCNQGTVSRWLAKLNPTTDMAQKRAHNLALESVESLKRAFPGAEKAGKHGPQATILEMAGLIKGDEFGPKVVVQIGTRDSDVQVQVVSPPA